MLVAILEIGCKHDVIEPEVAFDICDPDTVYFKNDVLPVILSSCGIPLCHDQITASEGVIMTTYDNIIATAGVKPFDLGGSKMYEMITETDLSDVMPPSPRGPLSQRNIDVITEWILQGALNNSCEPDTICMTASVSYANDIWPIIDKQCEGCHSGSNPFGAIQLRNYNEVKTIAESGQLYGTIVRLAGFVPMPYQRDQLSVCEIDQIKSWVDDGAPNN
jgi:hypothetical protein